jgi:hypothetical protein
LIIEISGGSSGISEYLESGVKNGRDFTRDELDQRIILQGDIDTLDDVIDSFGGDKSTEKYLHITLSFKESFIEEEVMRSLDSEFKDYIFSAYDHSEFCYYSEIHNPKIKTYTDYKGVVVERKPHIHVVIPKINLESGKKENPLGLIKSNLDFIDAFQERANEKYGFISPKDNLRKISTGKEESLSRIKFIDKLTNQDIKRSIGDFLKKNPQIKSQDKLIESLSDYGAARIVTPRTGENYINFKPTGEKKGVNLKGSIFSEAALSGREINKSERIEKSNKDARHWESYRSLEVRHVLQSGERNKKLFSILTSVERKEFLETKHNVLLEKFGYRESKPNKAKHSKPVKEWANSIDGLANINSVRTLDNIKNIGDIQNYADRNPKSKNNVPQLQSGNSNGSRDRGGNSAKNILSGNTRYDLERRSSINDSELLRLSNSRDRGLNGIDWTEKIKNTDCELLLDSLISSHGLKRDEYSVSKNVNKADKIQTLDKRSYSASDFLSKEMHLNWSEIKPLIEASQHSVEAKLTHLVKPVVNKSLWKDFKNLEKTSAKKHSPYLKAIELRKSVNKDHAFIYDKDKSYVQNETTKKLLKFNKARMLLNINDEYNRETTARKKPPIERYLDYLKEKSIEGDASALKEIKALMDAKQENMNKDLIISGEANKSYLLRSSISDYTIDSDGAVNYQADAKTIFKDQSDEIKVYDRSLESITLALQLANERFGNKLVISGATAIDENVITQASQSLGIKKLNIEYEGKSSIEIDR